MNKYNSYKDSGVKWIGKIPSSWSKSKFKYLTTKNVQYGVNSSSDNYIDDGIRFIRTTDIDDFGNLKPGGVFVSQNEIDESQITDYLDFLVSRSGTLGRTYLHKLDEQMTYGGYLVRFNFGKLITSKFLQYYCYSTNFWDWINLNTIVSTIGNVNGQKYNNMDVPFPPLSEQQQIVSFLDTKTSLIDSLTEKTQQKIELLKEKRTSLINEVVTKGLNPNVEMKDSGVEWIGEIPSHYQIGKLKHLCNENQRSLSNSTDPNYKLNYIEISDVNSEGVIGNSTPYIFSESPSRCRRIVQKGDVIVSTVRTYLKSIGLIEEEVEDLICSTGFSVLTPDTEINSKYLFYLLRTEWFISMVISNSEGVSYPSIQSEKLMNIDVVFCEFSEQQQIVEYLDEQTQLIDKTVSIEEKRIELLKEYRQSLISELVTGKRKVV
ncbi:restriction endonuclease subunit S [Hellea sp.]|nr:restriction endonuclease subunit S [Hellea sp.]